MSGSGTTSTAIANRAVAEIAGQAQVAGLWPNFTGAGNVSGYCNILYQGVVNMVARQQDYECFRAFASLVPTGNPAPAPFSYEYVYPPDCLKIRQIVPSTYDKNDPQPIQWSVLAGSGERVIATDVPPNEAQLVYTTSYPNVTEAEWDSLFQEAVVRVLASELSMAIAGRPDFSRVMLEQGGQLIGAGAGKDS